MKKKFVCLFLAMALMTSLLAVNVSAAGTEWISLDFENDTVGEMPESFPRDLPDDQNAPATSTRTIVDDNGNKIFKIDNMASATPIINSISTSAAGTPDEVLIMFDIKVNDGTANGYTCFDFLVGNKAYTRVNFFIKASGTIEPGNGFNSGGWSRPAPHKIGEWHRYLLHWTGIGTSASAFAVYSKPLNDANAEYTYVATSKPHSSAGWAGNTVRARNYSFGMDFCLDNFCIWNGNVEKGGYFEMDGEKIESIADVTSGTLKATAKITSGNMETDYVCPVMVVLDAKGRMLDCEFAPNSEINIGPNKLTAEVDTTEYVDRLEGGYAGFYIWQDLITAHPLYAPVELN